MHTLNSQLWDYQYTQFRVKITIVNLVLYKITRESPSCKFKSTQNWGGGGIVAIADLELQNIVS